MDEQNSQNSDLSLSVTPDNVVSQEKPNLILNSASIQATYQGPIPTPAMLEDFGKIDPELPKIIVKMAEESNRAMVNKADSEAEKNRAEADRIRSDAQVTKRGQWMVLGIIAAILVSAIILAFAGHDVVAVAFVSALAAVGILMGIHKRSGKQN